MGLFDFLKKKEEINFGEENDLGKILNLGILFEDNNKLLKWGVPVTDLVKQVEVKEKKFADRTVYNWGEQTILNGLKLTLTTTYWNHREDSVYKRLNSIGFVAVGDDEAGKYLRLIGMHLENKFGPGKNIEGEPKSYFEWNIGEVRITLCFMEKVSNKLHFEISKL